MGKKVGHKGPLRDLITVANYYFRLKVDACFFVSQLLLLPNARPGGHDVPLVTARLLLPPAVSTLLLMKFNACKVGVLVINFCSTP